VGGVAVSAETMRAWCSVCGATQDNLHPLAVKAWLEREHAHPDPEA
jgi:hypothetical protein